MPVAPRSPLLRARPAPDPAPRAFTLLELLAVIAIIAVLTGIVIGVGRRASTAGKVAQAKAELAVLSAALESYKRQYGDYPQAGAVNFALPLTPIAADHANVRLYNALTGFYGPKINELQPRGREFIELVRFSTETADTGMATAALVSAPELNALLDPWGNRYVYYYRSGSGATWTQPGYVLYSVGPDGARSDATEFSCHEPPAPTGIVDYNAHANVDNLYANRP
ncbi:MAG: prepilin-type N-terminal cleavage/methylation domain-containing protein [Candidatus Didemnitutus sp.]|nr:prepilin-type N-terminal cleavage/methylation domain-containing protein [Candidatus Didemnitutus sp.]